MSHSPPISVNPLQNGELAIGSVVFATDLSSVSQKAALYAAMLARHFQAKLVIAHAFIPCQSAEEVEVLKQQPSADRIDRFRKLEETASPLRVRGLHVRTQLLEGDPSDKIPAFADAQTRPLLVLGTHGGSSLGRRLIGSTAERCLRRVACPTITVGPHVSPPDGAKPFRTILYATDSSTMASRAAPFACAVAGSFQSELRVISIVDEHDRPVPDLIADLDFRTQEQIKRQLPGACDHLTESRAVATAGDARDQILRYAADTRSELLILGVHRRGTIELLDRNSITIQLIARATCPVLTLTGDAVPDPIR
jgi:nucleotide-binding universal stress UspA family protein